MMRSTIFFFVTELIVINKLASCLFLTDGEIRVKNYNPEYQYTINSIKFNGSTMKGLAPGEFIVEEKIPGECTFTYKVIVEAKPCLDNEEYVFSKIYDDGVTINLSFPKGQFIIYSKRGEELFVSDFDENQFFWDGTDANGNPLNEGYYPCLIKSPTGEILKTAVTIAP